MSWLFSQALVAEYSAENYLDGVPSAPSSGESTPLAYCAPDRMKAFSRLSRFGVTFKPLTENLGADVLTLYLAAFPVRTSALPEKAQESTANARECGATWLGSLGKYDPASRSWKTAQRSFLGDLEESLATWPRSGMTAGGECWELPMLEPIISGTDSGSELQTWPTPNCIGFRSDGELAILARNLTDHAEYRQIAHRACNSKLERYWPTPTANDSKNSTLPESQRERDGLAGSLLRTGEPTGGQLNPTFVEWLMGWPLGWTDLKPLGTDKSPSVLQQHGECLEGQ